jgi:hypothetical protein
MTSGHLRNYTSLTDVIRLSVFSSLSAKLRKVAACCRKG